MTNPSTTSVPQTRGRKPSPVADRFWSKVQKSEGCWAWTGYIKPDGYGKFMGVANETLYAHRVAWELTNGPIPSGLTVDHLCRNRSCVNPSHMEIVTGRENTLRSEGITAQNSRKTHCDKGHSLADAYVYPNGKRRCRTCKKTHNAAERAKKMEKSHV